MLDARCCGLPLDRGHECRADALASVSFGDDQTRQPRCDFVRGVQFFGHKENRADHFPVDMRDERLAGAAVQQQLTQLRAILPIRPVRTLKNASMRKVATVAMSSSHIEEMVGLMAVTQRRKPPDAPAAFLLVKLV